MLAQRLLHVKSPTKRAERANNEPQIPIWEKFPSRQKAKSNVMKRKNKSSASVQLPGVSDPFLTESTNGREMPFVVGSVSFINPEHWEIIFRNC